MFSNLSAILLDPWFWKMFVEHYTPTNLLRIYKLSTASETDSLP